MINIFELRTSWLDIILFKQFIFYLSVFGVNVLIINFFCI